mgnify:CR=1 FL=1|tara:strand:- start:293 stop:499 length:207 start_codon:yes stop_codon:yes gene_type:complete
MGKESIKFTIKQDGTVEEEVMGVQGDTCQGLTKELESKLGDLQMRVYKSEYYQQKDVTLQQNKNQTNG